MTEWQPIETAPRDGTEIIAFDPRADLDPVFLVHYEEYHWYDRGGRIWMPTHWMPLPRRLI